MVNLVMRYFGFDEFQANNKDDKIAQAIKLLEKNGFKVERAG